MCDSCKCGCKPGKPEKGCQCSCKECRAARQSVSKGFLVSKRDYQDFTQGAAIAGGSMAGMAGYGKLRRMKGVNGAMPFKGGLAASAVGGLGAYLATDAAFKRRKKNARDLAQYRAMVGKSLFELSGMAKENAMNEKYLVSKAFRDLDEVEKNFLTPVKGIRGGFMTRRFPEFTSSGKRQLAAKKAQRASDNEVESAFRSRARQESYRTNVADNASRDAAFKDAAAYRKRAAAKANSKTRLPADMQGVSQRSYY